MDDALAGVDHVLRDPDSQVSVEPLTASAFDDVYPLLADHDDRVSRERWRGLFDYEFEGGTDVRGYGLVAQGRVVGFVGAVLAQRAIGGRSEAVCNLTSWIVRPEYRAHSLALLAPLLDLPEVTLTDLSATPEVEFWLKRWRFTVLETAVVVLRPRRPWDIASERGIGIHHGHDAVGARLVGDEARIFADHSRVAQCRHLVVENDQGHCYLVYSPVRSHGHAFGLVHYVGDPDVFARTSLALRGELARAGHGGSLVVDERLLGGRKTPRSHRVPLRVPRYYRGHGLRPDQIDNLYSELALLGLSTISGRRLSPILQRLDGLRSSAS